MKESNKTFWLYNCKSRYKKETDAIKYNVYKYNF